MEILYVITNNDELEYVEFDEVKIPKEIMIEKLQKSDKVKEIYEGISNFGPIGLLWEKEENEDEVSLTDEEYEELVKASAHPELLDFYSISNATAEMLEDVYNYLCLKRNKKWIIAPEVLQDDTLMNELYKTLKEAVVSEMKENNKYVFDTEHDKHHGEHKGTEKVLDILDIHKKVMFDSCMNDADTTTLDALIEDEVEAIKAYDEAIKEAQFEEAIGIYEHIKGEEEEHLKELMELKERVSRG